MPNIHSSEMGDVHDAQRRHQQYSADSGRRTARRATPGRLRAAIQQRQRRGSGHVRSPGRRGTGLTPPCARRRHPIRDDPGARAAIGRPCSPTWVSMRGMRSLRCGRSDRFPRRHPAVAAAGRCAGALGLVVGLVVGLGGAALPADELAPAPMWAREGTPGAVQGGRDVYAWPFSWDSIWNLPLAATAAYRPFDTQARASSSWTPTTSASTPPPRSGSSARRTRRCPSTSTRRCRPTAGGTTARRC